jgi:hypothetical protein
MSDLAHNLSGETFEVPGAAVGWRVRKLKAKGAPEVVYGRSTQTWTICAARRAPRAGIGSI